MIKGKNLIKRVIGLSLAMVLAFGTLTVSALEESEHVHSIEKVKKIKATCTEDGYEEHYECTLCGQKFSDAEGLNSIESATVISALGHSWDPVYGWTDGYHWLDCMNGCYAIDSYAEHSFTDGVCVCGYIKYETLDGNNASYVQNTTSGEGLSFRFEDSVEKFEFLVIDDRTVNSSNYTVKSGCDSVILTLHDSYLNTLSAGSHTIFVAYRYGSAEANFVIAANNDESESGHVHSTEKIEKLEATCTEDGYEAYYECTTCGQKFSDEEGAIPTTVTVISKKGHEWVEEYTFDNISHWHDCARGCYGTSTPVNHTFTDGVCDCGCIKYETLEGENISYEQGTTEGELSFRFDGAESNLMAMAVYVDGCFVDPSNYTIKSGSVIVTLHNSYLNTLSDGNHTISLQYKDGFAEANFVIVANNDEAEESDKVEESETGDETDNKKVDTVKTSDSMNIVFWLTFVMLSGMMLFWAGHSLIKKH